MIKIIILILVIIILYLCIWFLYREYKKTIDDIEDHIIKNEMRFDNELINQQCYTRELNKGIQCKTEDIKALENRIKKLERSNKNENRKNRQMVR